MPPLFRPGSSLGWQVSSSLAGAKQSRPVCLLCSLAQTSSSRHRRNRFSQRRHNSEAVAAVEPPTSSSAPAPPEHKYANPRSELEKALLDLQKDAAPYVNLSRIQLALRNLRQDPGEESVRIAILALPGHDSGGSTTRTAKKLLRALIADPLSSKAKWEDEIEEHDMSKPLVVRIGRMGETDTKRKLGEVEFHRPRSQNPLLHELHADSPEFNGHGIEVLMMESNGGLQGLSAKQFEEQTLVPSVEIQSGDARYSPIMTPVHKTLIVGDGFQGALALAGLPPHDEGVLCAANISGYRPDDRTKSSAPFAIIDLPAAEEAIEVFRSSISKGMEYERHWFDSNFPTISKWLKHGALRTDDGSTKMTVIALITSLLRQADAAIEIEAARRAPSRIIAQRSQTHVRLEQALAKWSESAHRELQNSLTAAFKSRRWRRLGWWRLFWRVDDVSMIAGEVLSQHFLIDAERNVVYLAGRIKEAGVFERSSVDSVEEGYLAPKPFTGEELVFDGTGTPMSKGGQAAQNESKQESEHAIVDEPRYTLYPSNITHTRAYLSIRTVPALQALAQRLVLQTTSTVGTTSALGVLMFLSNFTLEAAGAVAALGAVWSFRRMQARWEGARSFWAGEVREEGRKAVKAVEASVTEALERGSKGRLEKSGSSSKEEAKHDIERARQSVGRAKDILRQLR